MAIVRRTQMELTEAEMAAILKFFKENQELDPKFEVLNANKLEAALHHMGAVIDAESIRVAYNILKNTGDLRIITPEKRKFDAAVKRGSYSQTQINILFAFLKSFHLVHDLKDQRSYDNAATVLNGMAGYDYTASNMRWVVEGAQARGTKFHWLERRDPDRREFRGHPFDKNDPDSYRFMPKDQCNLPFLPSHSSNPRLNGEKERLEREEARKRFGYPDEDVAFAHNAIWKKVLDDAVAEGRTHTERNRIAKAAQQAHGGIRLQAHAAQQEAAAIRKERERAR